MPSIYSVILYQFRQAHQFGAVMLYCEHVKIASTACRCCAPSRGPMVRRGACVNRILGASTASISPQFVQRSRQDRLIPRPIVLDTDDLRVEPMAETFAIPGLVGELIAALFRETPPRRFDSYMV